MKRNYNEKYLWKLAHAALAALLLCSCVFPYPIRAEEEPYQVLSFTPLDQEQRELQIPYGTSEEEIPFPEALEAEVQKIGDEQSSKQRIRLRWQCAESYDGEKEKAQYVWHPLLPDGYTLQETAAIPSITVTIQEKPIAKPVQQKPRTVLTSSSAITTEDALQLAITSAEANIRLENDIVLTSFLDIKNIVSIDLNGHKLYRNLQDTTRDGMVIKVNGESAKLTITDTSDTGNGEISGGKNKLNGGGIYLSDNASLIMNGGTVRSNTADQGGGGIYIEKGASLKMNGGCITENTTTFNGGGIQVYGGSIELSGNADVGGNNYSTYGGGIYIKSSETQSSTLSMNENCVIHNNVADYGGGIYLDTGTLTMNGGTIEENTGNKNGGGISTTGGSISLPQKLELYGGRIKNNTIHVSSNENPSNPNAAGVSANDKADVSIKGDITITGNTDSQGTSSNLLNKNTTSLIHILEELTGSVGIANKINVGKQQIADADQGYRVTQGDLARILLDNEDLELRVFDNIIYICYPYVLTFSTGNHGTGADHTEKVIEGDNVGLSGGGFQATGYEHIGWSTSISATEPLTSYIMPAKNSTLYAVWNPISYTIKFHANGGSGTMNDQKMVYAKEANLNENTFTLQKSVSYNVNEGQLSGSPNEKISFLFQGWSKTSTGSVNFSNKAAVTNLASTQDAIVNLYAVWETSGGILPSATRDGYQLAGWYEDEAYQTLAGKAGAVYKPEANGDDANLYAKWKDITAPSIEAATTARGWVHEAVINITYDDNEAVTKLMVKIDDSDYKEIGDLSSGNKKYVFSVIEQGEHTYQFKAEDAQGNEAESEAVTIQYDSVKPKITNANTEDVQCITAQPKLTLSEDGKLYIAVNPETEPNVDAMKKQGAKSYTAGEATLLLTNLAAGKENLLYVMIEDKAGNLSDIQKLPVYTKPETPDETAFTIQYDTETIIWDMNRYEISDNREFPSVINTKDLEPYISASTEESQTLYIRVKKAGNIPNSDPYAIQIPKRRSAPSMETPQVSSNRILVKSGLEYSLDSWNTVNTTGEFQGLQAGKQYTLSTRSPCTDREFVSEAAAQQVKTMAVMKLTQIGSGIAQCSAVLDKREGLKGDIITASITTTERYMPHITIAGRMVSPRKIMNGRWKFSYIIQDTDQEIHCQISYDDRVLKELIGEQEIRLSADHEANTSLKAIQEFLSRTYKGTAVYDNGVKEEVALSYTLNGTYHIKGTDLEGTASFDSKNIPVKVSIQSVQAEFLNIELVRKVEADGYHTVESLGLPTQVPVTLRSADGKETEKEYAVIWDALPQGLGRKEQQEDIFGQVLLPIWASGSSEIKAHLVFEKKENMQSALRVVYDDWTYGDSASELQLYENDTKLKNIHAAITYTGTLSNGDSYASNQVPTQSGVYTAHIHYEDSTKIADTKADFKIRRKEITVTQGTLKQEEKSYDGSVHVNLSGELQIIGHMQKDDIAVQYGSAQLDQPDAGLRAIRVKDIVLKGRDAANYSCKQKELSISGFVFQADGKKNPAYQKTYQNISSMHILTNVTETPADFILPKHWSLAASINKKQKLAGDNSRPLQPFLLRYTSADRNYQNVEAVYSIPVSTITVGFLGGLNIRKIPQPGEQMELIPQLTVTGAPMPDNGPFALDQLVWMNTSEEIVHVNSHGLKSADLTGLNKGLSMVGIRYPESAVLGYILVQVDKEGTLSGNKLEELGVITDILNTQINWERPSETARNSVNLVADEITKLRDNEKQELDEALVEKLDIMKQRVNKNLIINVHTDDKSELADFQVIGIAIASGVDEGVVDVYAISTFTDKRMLIELNLELKVNKNKKQLQSPLFFTMQVPEGWNPLYLYHRHEDGSVEQLEYMREGNTVKVRMDSFSSLVFMKEPYTEDELYCFAHLGNQKKDEKQEPAALPKEKNVVNSGDATDRMIWYFLMAAAGCVLVTSAWNRRNAHKGRE